MIKALRMSLFSAIQCEAIAAFCVFSLLHTSLFAQEHSCATIARQDDWLSKHAAEDHSRSVAELIFLPITFHTVAEDDGTGHYPIVKILESMCRLNEDFAPYDIQFYQIGDINEINRTRYYNHDNFSDGDRMMRTFNRINTINVYITNNAPSEACGYWLPSEDAIVVRKNCMGATGHTLTHEVGHYLALRHPFSGWEGKTYDPAEETPLFHGVVNGDTLYVESVSGSNCGKAADLICDTGPDYLSIGWDCDGSKLSLLKQTDPFGTTFKSDATNFMSYSNDHCQQSFTPQQVDVMHAFAHAEKSSIINRRPAPSVSENPISNMKPQGGVEVQHQSIELSWDAHPNASNYIVQISRFSFFASLEHEFVITDTKVNIGDLPVDRNFFWRVMPYNAFDHCSTFTVAEGGFSTVLTTQTHILKGGNQVQIYPTLISEEKSDLTIDFAHASLLNCELKLIDMVGHTFLNHTYDLLANQSISLSLDGIPTGTYILQIHTDQGSLSQLLFKQ